ncbi:hypothetical protein [Nocardioides sp.]|uniref:hypothetical protein n=1 Tax=Nocardioides sp. TaxID=35761 RepID=UPI002CA58B19|nr:hypothetical protein [Nocardioides sp.]HXH81037.1 hypothetical protein [Nocardioides sp.]
MSVQEAVQRVISPDYVGSIESAATDAADQVRVSLGLRGEVTAVMALQLTSRLKAEEGLREAVFEAANRAEAARVMNELALLGALDPEAPAGASRALAPLPGPTAPRLVVRSPDEQADHLARYIASGGLDPIVAPGDRWRTSSNGYLSVAINDRGQLAAFKADQEWLFGVSLDRLNNALKEAVES